MDFLCYLPRTPFIQVLSAMMWGTTVVFFGGGNRSTQRKPETTLRTRAAEVTSECHPCPILDPVIVSLPNHDRQPEMYILHKKKWSLTSVWIQVKLRPNTMTKRQHANASLVDARSDVKRRQKVGDKRQLSLKIGYPYTVGSVKNKHEISRLFLAEFWKNIIQGAVSWENAFVIL